MKKLYSLFVLAMCLMVGLSASAQTVVFDFAANPWGLPLGSGNGDAAAAGNITEPILAYSESADEPASFGVQLTLGGNPNTPSRMWTGPQLRCYKGAELTLAPLDETKAIVSVIFTASKFSITAATGAFEDKTWTGNQSEVTFAVTGTNQITKIEVTLADADNGTVTPGATVQTPVISPNGGTKKGSVTVTLLGDSTTSMYYTIDGTDPTSQSTLYTEPFTLTESATVKAIAYDAEGNNSAIASMTYTIEEEQTPVEPGDDPNTGGEAEYVFSPVSAIESGKQYLIVAQPEEGQYFVAQAVSSNYGYLKVAEVTPQEDGTIKLNSLDNAFTIAQSEDASAVTYTIQQNDGRYLYQTGNYNSFNLNAAPNGGQYFTIEPANEASRWTITNTGVDKYMQYGASYTSFGSYADEQGTLPLLYVLTNVNEVEPVDTIPSDPVDDSDYTTVTFPFSENPWQLETGSGSNQQGGAIAEPLTVDGVTLTTDNGGGSTVVRMWDTNGNVTLRVYKGTSIQFAAEDETKAIYKVVFDATLSDFTTEVGAFDATSKTWTGNATAVNFVRPSTVSGTMQVKSATVYLGERNEETVVPGIYVAAPVISPAGGERNDSVTVTIKAGEGAYIYYTTDGSEPTWDATLYTEAFKLYESATVKAIAYDDEGNASSVVEVAFTITASEQPGDDPVDPSDDNQSYVFTQTNVIESGKQYLIVAQPADAQYVVAKVVTSNYGYLKVDNVTLQEDGTIKVDNLDNAFTFTQSEDASAVTYTIQQSDGRFLYQTGNFNSFNLNAAPSDGQYFTASLNNDGTTWTITNTSVNKFMQYSIGYTSFGSYAEAQENAVLPMLFVLSSSVVEEPNDDEVVIFSESATSSNNQLTVEDVEKPEAVTAVWKFNATYGATASGYDSANKTNVATESWLRTPIIAVPASTDEEGNERATTLTFSQAIGYVSAENAAQYLRLFVRVADNSRSTSSVRSLQAAGEWQPLTFTFPDLQENKNFSSFADVEIDLSEFAGQEIELGFQYTSDETTAPTWEIRNIEVTCRKKAEDPTAIQNIEVTPVAGQGAVYDLQGRRVANPTRGIYIVGGRKVYIK